MESNERYLRVALYQGDQGGKKVRKIPAAAANVNESKEPLTDPTILCCAFKKHRIYMFRYLTHIRLKQLMFVLHCIFRKNQPLLVSLDFRRHFSPVSIIFYSYLVITELFMEINTRKLKSAVGESQKNLKMQAKEGMCSTRSLLLMNLCLSQILETHPQRLSQRTWYVLHNPSNCFTNH